MTLGHRLARCNTNIIHVDQEEQDLAIEIENEIVATKRGNKRKGKHSPNPLFPFVFFFYHLTPFLCPPLATPS